MRLAVQLKDETAIAALWEKYKSQKDMPTRNALVENYLYLVRTIVFRMMPMYQSYANYDDLISCGVLGLMDAVDKYDLARGVKFETYAYMRIRGEIIDYMRRQDWAPSSLRRQINQVMRMLETIEMEQGRPATEEQTAERLGISVQEVRQVLEKSYMFNLVYFEDLLHENFSLEEVLQSSEALPHQQLEKLELNQALAAMIEQLPHSERTVVTLYYFEEMPLKDIAATLGVSPSRVSQIHSKVLAKLRNYLLQQFPS